MTSDATSPFSAQSGFERPLKVLQIHNHYRESGGEDTVVAKEAALLRDAGHTVVEYRAANPTRPVATAASLVVSPWNLVAARRLEEIVAEQRPDIAHVHNTWWVLSPSVFRVLERANVPVVMTLHNYRLLCANAQLYRDGRPCEDCVGTHPWRGVQNRCYRNSMSASSLAAGTIALNRRLGSWDSVRLFLALTDFARDRFIAGGLSEERVKIKPNFVADPGVRINLPSESSTVLYVGRITEEKGLPILLEAWSRSATADLELVVVGDGPLRSSLQKKALRGVRFIGAQTQDEVSKLMRCSRAMVFPSVWYEGQPMVLLEALAAGLPVLASDIGGIPGTLADAGTEMLVRPGDPTRWSGELLRLLDGLLLDDVSQRSRNMYVREYSPGPALNRILDAYQAAIRSG